MTNESELTPLMIAARQLDYENCAELLNNPLTDPNVQDTDGKTAFMHLLTSSEYQPNPDKNKELARQNRKRETARLNIAKAFVSHPQTDINLSDNNGNTAYIYASQKKCYNICEEILAQFDVELHEVNYNGENYESPAFYGLLLINAIARGNDELVDKLLQGEQINVNVQNNKGNTPLIVAGAKNNQYALDKLLARDDIDINVQNKLGRTVLANAIKANNLETVIKIAEREEVDYSLKDNYGMGLEQLIIENGNPEIFHAFREAPLDYNSKSSKGIPLLWDAVQKGKTDILNALVEYRMCDVNVPHPETGDTLLMLACGKNDGKFCRDLIAAGADVNVTTKGEKSAISEAIFTAARNKYTNTDCLISLLNSQNLNQASCQKGAEIISEITRRMNLRPPAKIMSSLEKQLFKYRKQELKKRQNSVDNQNSAMIKPKRPRIGQNIQIFPLMRNKKQKDD